MIQWEIYFLTIICRHLLAKQCNKYCNQQILFEAPIWSEICFQKIIFSILIATSVDLNTDLNVLKWLYKGLIETDE